MSTKPQPPSSPRRACPREGVGRESTTATEPAPSFPRRRESTQATARILDSRLRGNDEKVLRGNDEIRLVGLAPVVSPTTRLLVLGSFPGVASLQAQQYYAHPRNHFWPIVGALLGVDLMAMLYQQRLAVARERGLGLWDTYAACQRQGSLDAAIQKAEFNELAGLVSALPLLRGIAHNGGESARGMKFTASFGVPVFRLPSTSPANASWAFERKLQAWREAFVATSVIPA